MLIHRKLAGSNRISNHSVDHVPYGTAFLQNEDMSCMPIALNTIFNAEIFGNMNMFNAIQLSLNSKVWLLSIIIIID